MCRESKLRRQWDKARSFEANRASTRNPHTSEARRHAVTVTAPLPSVARWRLRAQSPAHHRMREQGRPRTRTHRATARARARRRAHTMHQRGSNSDCISRQINKTRRVKNMLLIIAKRTHARSCRARAQACAHLARARHARTTPGQTTRTPNLTHLCTRKQRPPAPPA